MREFDYLIAGGGLAAVNAVEGLRQVDPDGTVAVLSGEEEPPYHRPPLSKEYLQVPGAGRELLHVKPEGWYDEAGVEMIPGVRATGLDPQELVLEASDGEAYGADRILLATGGRPRTLELPGAGLEGVRTFRTVEDAEAVADAAGRVDRAVLVGAGFIGMELAASLVELGVDPLVVELEDRVWSRMLPPELSDEMQAHFEARGVQFRLGTSVRELRGEEGRVEAAVLDDGAEVPCGLAVVGVGILPNQELAEEAGLAVDDGVLVDEFGETSHGHVYAAGDVARFPDPVFGDRSRVEHWDHAKAHGRRVGRNLAGEREGYDHLSYFFSDVFDLSLSVFGRPGAADRTLRRGEVLDGENGGMVFCGSGGRLCAVLLVNESRSMDACRELVRRRPPLEELEGRLTDPRVDLAEVTG